MATVYIPALLRELVGREQVEAEGSTVRQVIASLDRQHPGIRDRLIDGDRLRTNVSVAVDGEVTPLGLLADVGPDSEVHFVLAISGGSTDQNTVKPVCIPDCHLLALDLRGTLSQALKREPGVNPGLSRSGKW